MKEVKMTFEEWGERLKQTGDKEDFQPINIAKLYTAWNDEREKWQTQIKEMANIINREYVRTQKLIEALEPFTFKTTRGITVADLLKARAVLTEVEGKR